MFFVESIKSSETPLWCLLIDQLGALVDVYLMKGHDYAFFGKGWNLLEDKYDIRNGGWVAMSHGMNVVFTI